MIKRGGPVCVQCAHAHRLTIGYVIARAHCIMYQTPTRIYLQACKIVVKVNAEEYFHIDDDNADECEMNPAL